MNVTYICLMNYFGEYEEGEMRMSQAENENVLGSGA